MKTKNHITLILLVFIGIYVLGWIFPDSWWGTHSLAFLPININIAFVLLLIITWLSSDSIRRFITDKLFELPYFKYYIFSILVSLGFAWLFHHFPIALDAYGDALRFKNFFSGPDNQFKPVYLKTLLSWNIVDWQNGERTVLNGAHFLAHTFNISAIIAFKWIATICGGLYVFATLIFTYNYKVNGLIKAIAAVLFLTAPFIWMFFGHMEIYSPSVLAASLFCMVLLLFFDKPSTSKLFGLLVLLFISIKLHSGHFLLLIPYVLGLIWFLQKNNIGFIKYFNWKFLSLILLLPLALAGLYLYFFIFQDHVDLRVTAPLNEQIFLPLFAPPAPLERYNMLSFAHFFDYINLLFMFSAAAFFSLVVAVICFRKSLNWNHPKVIVFGIALLLYLGFFFVFNPLLGMPLDVDLFSISAPVLITFVIVVLSQVTNIFDLKQVFKAVLLLSLMTLPLIMVNTNINANAKKLTSLGVRTFSTYWTGAVRPMLVAMVAFANSRDVFKQHVEQLLAKLEPDITQGNDIEYAELLRRIAQQYEQGYHQNDIALKYLEQSFYQDKNNKKTAFKLMQIYFEFKDYAQAYKISQQLIVLRYPSYQRALRIATHCALMTDDYQAAQKHVQEYLTLQTNDDFMQSIHSQLKSGTNLEELKNKFHK